tara:strand:- start:287 stop:808 length:522 start_codon:yes stop_codon:yes gene_type:complete
MKVAFIGTHGTGKTTLAHKLIVLLKEQQINAGFCGEYTEVCPFPINKATTIESQEWLFLTKYLKELELEPKYEVLVCDRSALDTYAYYSHKFGSKKWMEDFVREKAKDYQLLIKVPINKDYLTEDGIRSVDQEFQKNIDKRFDSLLNELKIPFTEYENLNSIVNFIKDARSTI